MPALSSLSRRRAVTLLVLSAACAAALSTACAAVPAAEPGAAPAPTSAASAAVATAASGAAPTTKPARPAIDPTTLQDPRDLMDFLRQRLAQKFGAALAPDPANPNVLRVSSKASAPHRRAAGAEAAHARTPHWDYAGSDGPAQWGRMSSAFSKCSSGARQSPIDIRDGIRVELEPVQFDYRPSAFRVIDNGHTVQVNVAGGNSIEVMGRRYELVHFDFHRPSEERIDGKQFDMVVHLVHQDLEGRIAVVAVLLERGSAQGLVQSVLNNLPLDKGEELAAPTPLDPKELLPVDRRYFTYMGSLTTPPCSEGVLWMVMKQPVQVSAEQIDIFARLYPMNARPIQSAAGRLIKESN